MKKNFMILMGAAAMMLASTACSSDCTMSDVPNGGNNGAELIVNGTIGDDSRAINTSWEAGDAIGLSSDFIYNKRYTTSTTAGAFTPTIGKDYIIDGGTHSFTAYYPYSASTPENLITFTVQADANPTAQKRNDFMFATGSASHANPVLNLKFKHKMARLVINLRTSASDGYNADDVFGTVSGSKIKSTAAFLASLCSNGNFNVLTGEVKKGTTIKDFDMTNPVDDTANHVRTYTLLIPEQAIGEVVVRVNEGLATEHYLSGSLGTGTWQGGYTYTYNVTLKSNALSVSSATIEAWTDGGSKDIVPVIV